MAKLTRPACIHVSMGQLESLYTTLPRLYVQHYTGRGSAQSRVDALQIFLSSSPLFVQYAAHLILVQLAHQRAGDEVVAMHGHHQRPAVR